MNSETRKNIFHDVGTREKKHIAVLRKQKDTQSQLTALDPPNRCLDEVGEHCG